MVIDDVGHCYSVHGVCWGAGERNRGECRRRHGALDCIVAAGEGPKGTLNLAGREHIYDRRRKRESGGANADSR